MKLTPLAFSLSSTLALLVTGCQSEPEGSAAPAPQSPASSASSSSAPSRFSSAASVDASGWVTTASGLRYQVLASGPGTGQSPAPYDSVTVHYKGTLTNGSVFDSSIERGQPATFGVGQVIPGWTEALQLMKPGDKWMLYIPSQLAYGSRAVGGKIPANSDLIFQVELLKVN